MLKTEWGWGWMSKVGAVSQKEGAVIMQVAWTRMGTAKEASLAGYILDI